MYCMFESNLFVKANGEIPCGWCGSGQDKILHQATKETNFINDILFSDNFNHIRNSLARNVPPWRLTCSLCFLLDKNRPFYSDIIDRKFIEAVRIEASFLCQLDCVACFPSRKDRKKVKSPPYNMPIELFTKIVDDIYNAEYTVGSFDFAYGGEPLMNKDVWEMVAYARKYFPQSNISLCTNGNFKFNEESIQAGLSKLVVSVDGCFQDSYEIYRRNGNIDMAFRFMEQFANEKKKQGKDTELIWKYLLFSHNDSTKELIETQKKAMELGVDVLSFHVTPLIGTCKRSRFYNKNKAGYFPLVETGTSDLKIVTPEGNHPMNDFICSFNNNKFFLLVFEMFSKLFKKKG